MGLKKAINLLVKVKNDPGFNSLDKDLRSEIDKELEKEIKKQRAWGMDPENLGGTF